MQIDGVSNVGSLATEPQTTNQTNPELSGLGEDAFMKLLLAQLQNQDPLKPMEDKDFIAQLAQFNSLNQLTAMNKKLGELMTTQTLSQGSALIGKMVSGLSSEGSSVTGLVSGLYMSDGTVLLDIEGKRVPLDTVQTVQDVPRSENDDEQDQSAPDSGSGDQQVSQST